MQSQGTVSLHADAAMPVHDAVSTTLPSLTQLAVEAAAQLLMDLDGDVDTAIACELVSPPVLASPALRMMPLE
jgi:hypothetical protein